MDKSRKNLLAKELPKISVIMPVRNEAAFIGRSLGAVLKQDFPSDRMEVIIADGMSEDKTREIIRKKVDEDGRIAIRIIDNPGLIVPKGLNVALKLAKGDIIIRVDGHCKIQRDYVSRCVEHILGDAVDGVGGPIETIGETALSKTIALGMSSRFGVGGSAFRTIKDETSFVDTVAFPAYSREAVSRCGPFDEELVRNQDDEYNYRLRKFGGRILLAPDVKSRYYSRSSISSLWRQYYEYGYWKVRVLQKHPRQMMLRQFVPPAFVTALLASASLAPFFGWARTLLILLAISYSVANISASAITAWKKGWQHLPLLPLVFATLHLSYGSGFLVGLVRFANRWRSP